MMFVVVSESPGRWSWELQGADGAPVLKGTRTYADRAFAERALEAVRHGVAHARVLGSSGVSLEELRTTPSSNEKAPK